jgi:LemA protein
MCMWSSPLFWIAVAISAFWALGAYNRLMRLRSAVVQAFGGFDAHIVRQLALLSEFGAAYDAASHPVGGGSAGTGTEMAALQGAATQLSASLAVARARPLRKDAIAALAAARDVLHTTWDKAARIEDIHTAAPATTGNQTLLAQPAPRSPWVARWSEHVLQNAQAISVFNDAVQHYNAAIAQFPANLLALAFGFKAARGL